MIGQVPSINLKQISVTMPQGNIHKSVLVDGKTGYSFIVLQKSKHAAVVFANVKDAIIKHFNQIGHPVQNIHTDSEPVYRLCSNFLNSNGIKTFFLLQINMHNVLSVIFKLFRIKLLSLSLV